MQFALSAAILLLSMVTAPIASAAAISNPPQPSNTPIPPIATLEAAVHKLFTNVTGNFENIAIRSNGQILTTVAFPSALLYYIDPLSIRPPVLLHNFTSFASVLGITELAHDIFYVAAEGLTGPHTVFSIDMRPFCVLPHGEIVQPPIIKAVADIPSAVAFNGMTRLSRSDSFVFIVDSLLGGIWRLEVNTGKSILIIQDPTMLAPPSNGSAVFSYGINGIKIRNNTLFYTNSGTQSMYKMPLHDDGFSAGKPTLISSSLSCDDFELDGWGFAYVASPSNAVIRLDTRTGDKLVVAGTYDDYTTSDIIGASSIAFGRGNSDRSSIYVTTNGASFTAAPPGSQGVSRVDVADLAEVCLGCEKW